MDSTVILEAKNGVYRCPYKCGDRRFPAPKWKTEAGARRHISQCPNRPEALADKQRQEQERQAAFEQAKASAISKARFKVGDLVHFVNMYVRKPTHENRNGRMVRMRYEEERIYSARSQTIETVGFDGYRVVYNHHIAEADIFPTADEAEQQARVQQTGYDARCKLAADCR